MPVLFPFRKKGKKTGKASDFVLVFLMDADFSLVLGRARMKSRVGKWEIVERNSTTLENGRMLGILSLCTLYLAVDDDFSLVLDHCVAKFDVC